MRISFVTTTGVTEGFRHWPEAVQARALVGRGHRVHAVTYFEAGSPLIGRAKEAIDGVAVRRVAYDRWWRSPDLATALRAAAPQVVHLWHLRNALNSGARSRVGRAPPRAGRLHRGRPVPRPVPGGRPRAPVQRPRALGAADLLARGPAARHRARAAPQRAWQNYRMHAPLRRADRVIALSDHEEGVLAQMGGRASAHPGSFRSGSTPTISGAFPMRRRPARTRTPEIPRWPIVLFIGQLKIRKGYDLLARAMPLVLANAPDARFVFAGQNPAQAAELEAICAANGSRGSLVLLGPVSEAAKVRLLRRAACLVYPTRYESFGLPPLEAMVAGCPVVSTNLPVVREMIQTGENGLLALPEDPDGLAAAICACYRTPRCGPGSSPGGRPRRQAATTRTPS